MVVAPATLSYDARSLRRIVVRLHPRHKELPVDLVGKLLHRTDGPPLREQGVVAIVLDVALAGEKRRVLHVAIVVAGHQPTVAQLGPPRAHVSEHRLVRVQRVDVDPIKVLLE